LVLGGCRSGKTTWAEEAGLKLATACACQRPHLVYIATAQGRGDALMQERIARHQTQRDPAWQTLEAPLNLSEALARAMAGLPCAAGRTQKRPQAILIDCVTVWLANLMGNGLDEQAILNQTETLAELLRIPACPVFLVSNETGLGVAPSTALGNAFRDLAGLVNQRLVKSCNEVYFIISGLACRLK
jgi:adenosylcobinamide kinase/adenosylcobinamide-phosphate guanylyltransferase